MGALFELISRIAGHLAAPFTVRRYRPYLRLLGFSSYRTLRRSLHDPREIMQQSAKLLGCSELEVALRVAQQLRLPCLARVQPVPAQIWPIDNTFDLDDFRGCAAIPLAPEGMVSGVVCVDPWEAKYLIEKLSGNAASLNGKLMPLYLAPWREISQALDLSAQNALQEQAASQGKQDQMLLQTAYRCIAVMLGHAEKAQAEWIELELGADSCAYSFPLKEGGRAGGRIDPLIRQVLHSVLGEKSDEPIQAQRQIYIPEIKRPLTVSHLADKEGFRLVLGEVSRKVLAFPEQSRIQESTPNSSAVVRKVDSSTAQVYSDYVLIVEDNLTFAQVLSRFLERHDFRSSHFNSCKAALEFLKTTDKLPAVIVCDLHLPETDGLAFTRIVKESPQLAEIPLLILTSDQDLETELRLLAAGADIYLNKDQDPRLLCAHVKKVLQKRSGREAA